MRKLLIVVMIMGVVIATAQVRLAGSNMIGVQGGVSGSGVIGGISYNHALKHQIELGGFLGFDRSEEEIVQMQAIFTDIYGKYYAMKQNNVGVYGKGGLTLSFDKTVDSELLEEKATKFGFHYGGGIDYMLSKFIIGVQFNQRHFTNKKFGSDRYSIGITLLMVL